MPILGRYCKLCEMFWTLFALYFEQASYWILDLVSKQYVSYYFERVYSDTPSESEGGRGYWMNKAFLAVRRGRPLGLSSNEVPLLSSETLAFDSSSRQNKIKKCH